MNTPSLTNFKQLLTYPFEDEKSVKKILIGSLLIFGSMIIPVIPMLIVMGYIMRISKRIIDGDGKLALPDWDDWGEFLKDGVKWFVTVFIFALPLIIIFSVGYFVYFASFLGMGSLDNAYNPSIWSVILPFFAIGVLFLTMFIGIFLAIFELIILPAGLMHVVHTGEISAAFKFKEWWGLLKKNFLGFLVAVIFLFGFYYFMMMAFSALYMSILFCFLIPFAMAPLSFLMGLWSIPLFAQAYRESMPESNQQDQAEESN